MMPRSELVDIDVHVHHTTASAILVESFDANSGKVWLPLSAIEINREGHKVEITLPRQLAAEKGLC